MIWRTIWKRMKGNWKTQKYTDTFLIAIFISAQLAQNMALRLLPNRLWFRKETTAANIYGWCHAINEWQHLVRLNWIIFTLSFCCCYCVRNIIKRLVICCTFNKCWLLWLAEKHNSTVIDNRFSTLRFGYFFLSFVFQHFKREYFFDRECESVRNARYFNGFSILKLFPNRHESKSAQELNERTKERERTI